MPHRSPCSDIPLVLGNKRHLVVAELAAGITAEDEVYAFSQAQAILEEQASQDETLLLQAQQRAQTLLENYIKNLGEAVGKQYTIQWVYLDAEGNPVRSNNSTTANSAESGEK